jgi:signal transduction histidine kinase/ActR/RegA family two-component response regulator
MQFSRGALLFVVLIAAALAASAAIWLPGGWVGGAVLIVIVPAVVLISSQLHREQRRSRLLRRMLEHQLSRSETLLEQEKQARQRAEAAEARAEFLARASTALASSHDYETTLASVVRLAVPHIADWAAVDLLAGDGSLQQLAVAHADPTRVEKAREWRRRYPPDPNSSTGLGGVLRSGQSALFTDITEEALARNVPNPEQRERLRGMGLRSAMMVPLSARGRVLGVMTFMTAESGRRYSPEDLTLAEDLAWRSAMAIDNARLYRDVEEADRRKDEFLAMLAHELRNPIAPIRDAARVLRTVKPGDEVLGRSGEVIERQVEHLSRLVNDLLDISRIMHGKIQLRREPIRVADIVADGVEACRSYIEARRHRLTIDLPRDLLAVLGDGTRLTQVIANLLNNAAKYTNEGGQLTIFASRERNEAVVVVRDNGMGIRAEQLPYIFDLFAQGDRTLARTEGGLGLGLTLVRRLVEMHGGTVCATSPGPGKGSEFVVRLPALAEEATPARKISSFDAGGAIKRVLVVDDNRDAADSLALLLGMAGYEVRTAHDGLAALDAALTWQPAVVILDIGLPKMDGFEVARRLRQRRGGEQLLLLALTGYGSEEDRKKSRAAGFDAHLVKPADLEDLRNWLESDRGSTAPDREIDARSTS